MGGKALVVTKGGVLTIVFDLIGPMDKKKIKDFDRDLKALMTKYGAKHLSQRPNPRPRLPAPKP